MNSTKCNNKKLPEYDMIYVEIDGIEYTFDDVSEDGTEYYIDYNFDHVDSVNFYISLAGKDIKFKTYSPVNVLDYNINKF